MGPAGTHPAGLDGWMWGYLSLHPGDSGFGPTGPSFWIGQARIGGELGRGWWRGGNPFRLMRAPHRRQCCPPSSSSRWSRRRNRGVREGGVVAGVWGSGLGVYRGWVLVPYRNELESIRVPLYRSYEPGFCTPLPLARMSIGLAHTNQVADPSRRVQGPN